MPDPVTTTTPTTTTTTTTNAATRPASSVAGTMSGWATPYVGDMLGKGMAYSNMAFTPYTGDTAADASKLQNQAFSGIAGLTTPTKGPMDVFTAEQAAKYANPFVSAVVNPQLREAQRQADIQRIADANRLVGAGAFGGSRQAIMEAEGGRNLQTLMSDITGKGYQQAYENAQQQFERDRTYGLQALGQQMSAGEVQRGIDQAQKTADYEQYLRQFNYPKEQLQLQSDLLKNIPEKALYTTNTYGVEPSFLNKILSAGGGILGLVSQLGAAGGNATAIKNIYDSIGSWFDPNNTSSPFFDTGANVWSSDYFGGTSEGE